MNASDKQALQSMIPALIAQSSVVRSMSSMPPPPVVSMPVGVPIPLNAALQPLMTALQAQTALNDKLLKLIGDLIAKS